MTIETQTKYLKGLCVICSVLTIMVGWLIWNASSSSITIGVSESQQHSTGYRRATVLKQTPDQDVGRGTTRLASTIVMIGNGTKFLMHGISDVPVGDQVWIGVHPERVTDKDLLAVLAKEPN